MGRSGDSCKFVLLAARPPHQGSEQSCGALAPPGGSVSQRGASKDETACFSFSDATGQSFSLQAVSDISVHLRIKDGTRSAKYSTHLEELRLAKEMSCLQKVPIWSIT